MKTKIINLLIIICTIRSSSGQVYRLKMNDRQFFHHCADITTDSAMRSESVIYDDNLASNTQFNFYFNDKTAEDLDQENKAEKYDVIEKELNGDRFTATIVSPSGFYIDIILSTAIDTAFGRVLLVRWNKRENNQVTTYGWFAENVELSIDPK